MPTPKLGFPPPTLVVSAKPLDASTFANESKESFVFSSTVFSKAALMKTGKWEIRATALSCFSGSVVIHWHALRLYLFLMLSKKRNYSKRVLD